MSQNPTNLQQFIESQKTQFATSKGIQAANEYMAIITPYVNQIIELNKKVKELQDKLPRKERVKVIKKGKK